jgi:hypothetical protein
MAIDLSNISFPSPPPLTISLGGPEDGAVVCGLIDESAQRDLRDDLQDHYDGWLTETDDSWSPMSLYSQDSSNNSKESLFMGRTATQNEVEQVL